MYTAMALNGNKYTYLKTNSHKRADKNVLGTVYQMAEN